MAVPDSIPLLIKNPHFPEYVFPTSVPRHCTVGDVKSHLSSSYSGRPAVACQHLVCSGRLLSNTDRLSELYETSARAAGGGQHDLILHLAIKEPRTAAASSAPSPAPLPPVPSTASPPAQQSNTPDHDIGSDSSSNAAAALPSQFVPPLAGYGVWPYALPSAQQLQLAWQWQQMAAAAQLGGLRQRQVSAPSARSPSAASSATPTGTGTASLFPSLLPPFHTGSAAAALRALPSPLFMSPFAMPATSSLAPHLAFNPSALPPFASPAATAPFNAAGPPAMASPPAPPASGPSSSPNSALPAPASSSSSSVPASPRSPVVSYVAGLRRYIDVRLLLKLSVLLLVFSRQGDSTRSMLLMGAAVLAYLWQVGLLRRRGREAANADAADGAAHEADGGAAEREAIAHARREAREERRAGAGGGAAGGGGGGLGGLLAGMAGEADDEDEEEDINLQREQLHIIQQQHQAELIRRGQRHSEQGEDGQNGMELDTWMSATEKLVVGLFASLVPSWRPTIDVQQ